MLTDSDTVATVASDGTLDSKWVRLVVTVGLFDGMALSD